MSQGLGYSPGSPLAPDSQCRQGRSFLCCLAGGEELLLKSFLSFWGASASLGGEKADLVRSLKNLCLGVFLVAIFFYTISLGPRGKEKARGVAPCLAVRSPVPSWSSLFSPPSRIF